MRDERGLFFALGVATGGMIGAASTYYCLRRKESETMAEQPLVLQWPGIPSVPANITTFEVSLSVMNAHEGYVGTVINFSNSEKVQSIVDRLTKEGELEKISTGVFQAKDCDDNEHFSILVERQQICMGATIGLDEKMKGQFLKQIEQISNMAEEPLYLTALLAAKTRLGDLWDGQLAQANRIKTPKPRFV